MFPKGLNLSATKPSLTLRGSEANSRCRASNDFHALPSAGCLNMPSFVQASTCHLIWVIECFDINNLCSLDINGNHRNTLTGFLFDIRDDTSSSLVSSFHFDFSHTIQLFNLLLSLQNNIQSLRHAGIFSYPSLKSLKYFLTSYVLLGKVP
jgi:hypothetical protein